VPNLDIKDGLWMISHEVPLLLMSFHIAIEIYIISSLAGRLNISETDQCHFLVCRNYD